MPKSTGLLLDSVTTFGVGPDLLGGHIVVFPPAFNFQLLQNMACKMIIVKNSVNSKGFRAGLIHDTRHLPGAFNP